MSKKIAAVFTAALALALCAPALQAQKALVYCPVGVDATGCDRIVAALQPKFPDGVDRGYDGTGSTVDLMKIDLEHYAVIVVPSLADDDIKQPYAMLRKAAGRLHLAINGRVAVYSGAPDQGSANRADKDAIIQNLATWSAKGHTRATGLVGVVAFLDLSENASARYSWVKSVSLADVSADAETQSIAELTPSGRGGDLLANAGQAIRFSNMASYGLHIGARAAARTEVGAMSTTTDSHQSVLVTYANADGKDLGTNGGRPGGASLDVSSGGGASGPTLTTDKPDYLPGDTVLFSGTGWAPNDTVTITVHEDPQWSNPDRTVTAVADGNGNLTSHEFVVQQRDFGVTFTATAVGNPSGLVAQVTFTDGNSTVSGQVTDAITHSGIAGATITCLNSGTNPCSGGAPTTTTTDATGHYSFTVNFSGGSNTVRLTASATGYVSLLADVAVSNSVNPTQNFALTPAGPTKLAFPNAAVTGVVNQCLTINIQTQNAGGTPTAVTSNTTVNLATDNGSGGAGAFYASNACTTTTTTIQINSGTSSGTFFYEATARGNGTHTLTVSATGLTEASQGETINKADQAALTITAPTTGIFGDKLTITTTGGSGTGALSFSAGASTACSIITTPGPDLKKLQITSGTGTCSVTATKDADNDFNSETSAPQTVTVSKATPAFSNLSSQTITFGTATTTFSGKLASGALVPTGNVSITLGTTPPVTQQATLAGDGTFSSAFNTTAVPASATLYTMTYAFTADNNFSAASDATTTLAVNKAAVVATLTAHDKTYDGTNVEPNASMSCVLTGVLPADATNVTCTPSSGTFNSSDVATATQVTATVSISGSAAGNYTLGAVGTMVTSTSATAAAHITTAAVTAALTAHDKMYNGTNVEPNANMSCLLTGVLPADEANVICTPSSGTFNSSDVASANQVTATVSLSGTAAGNYTLGAVGTTVTLTSATATAHITAAAVTATAGGGSAIYDGTAKTPAPVCAVTGPYTGDLTCANSPASVGPNVGTYPITPVVSGANLSNFTITSVGGSYTIRTSAITAVLTAGSRTYNGTNVEPNASMSCVFTGVLPTDALNVTCAPSRGTFNSSDVATANQVTATVNVSGSAAGNYTLGAVGTTVSSTSATAAAHITTAALTAALTAHDKVYNASNVEPDANMSCALTGVVGGDAVTCTGSSGTFNTPDVATANLVTATVTLGSAKAGDYTLGAAGTTVSSMSATATAHITAAAVTATAGGGSATYDGTAKTPAPPCAVTGPFTGDLTCANSLASVGPDAATYPITPVVSGANLSDFAIAPVAASYTINKASQTVVFSADFPTLALVDKNNQGSPFPISAMSFYGSPATTTLTSLLLSFAATGPCTVGVPSIELSGVSSVAVTPTGVGACTITATQAGNGDYFAATPVQGVIQIVRQVIMGPQAMEGDLKVPMGTTLEVGYDFTIPGAHVQETVSFSNALVTFPYTCVAGPSTPSGKTPVGSGTITVPMADASLVDPANSSAWYPSGNQSDPAVFQGSLQLANDLCTFNGLVRFQKGGTFTTGVASDGTSKVNIRWHYRANGTSGSWSGTLGVIPN